MIERILVQLFEVTLAIAAVIGVAVIFAATWHDMRAIARKTRLHVATSSLSATKQPLVSILVYAHNNASTIQSCLGSIVASNYERYKIIVVNNASTDTTISTISDYKKSHQNLSLTTLTLKELVDRRTALHIADKKTTKSDFIFTLDATDILSNATISRSVAHFLADRHIEALRIRQYFDDELTTKNLPEHFKYLSRNMLDKALSWAPLPRKRLHNRGVIIRGSSLSSATPAPRLTASYSSAITFVSAQTSRCVDNSMHLRSITFLWIIALLSYICSVTYFFYTTATLQSNTFLTLSWTLVSLWLAVTVWSDEILDLSKKIALTFTIPFVYFLLYVQSFVTAAKSTYRLFCSVRIPKIDFKHIHSTLLQEAYSMRF